MQMIACLDERRAYLVEDRCTCDPVLLPRQWLEIKVSPRINRLEGDNYTDTDAGKKEKQGNAEKEGESRDGNGTADEELIRRSVGQEVLDELVVDLQRRLGGSVSGFIGYGTRGLCVCVWRGRRRLAGRDGGGGGPGLVGLRLGGRTARNRRHCDLDGKKAAGQGRQRSGRRVGGRGQIVKEEEAVKRETGRAEGEQRTGYKERRSPASCCAPNEAVRQTLKKKPLLLCGF
ncbi:hypothetical protein BZA70DRAFT_112800 [Myxozyma melibiosi]|uniref:Uncharacterized protein n=1 Tax=Myxozyma melibiosi TaxID=54550 RepID=A0ABR1FAD2_9ASCO